MQLAMHMVTIEDLMPREHFLRKLEAALDLSFVYEETAPLYSKKYGRPAIDPVVIVKYLLVGFLYGIPSERQIEQRIQTDIALRWYLGLGLFDRAPDHSIVSQMKMGSRMMLMTAPTSVEIMANLGFPSARMMGFMACPNI